VTPFITLAAGVALLAATEKEQDPLKAGKITLKLTARATRVQDVAFTLCLVALAGVASLIFTLGSTNDLSSEASNHMHIIFWMWQIVIFQILPFLLPLSNLLLSPREEQIQTNFANEAHSIVEKYKPTVVGITGSYGKTSTKVILRDLLGSVCPTFTTPRSINSYMGVTREIRERLKPEHRFAIIEMGAYQKGSIAKLCSLVPPNAAIVTAVGEMHLERFGSRENVYLAKSELAQAVPENGILVVNGDDDMCRKMAAQYPKTTTLFYGMNSENGKLDATMSDILTTDKGTHFTIHWRGKKYQGVTPLLGKPMLSNALAAFTMACALGVNPEVAIAAIRNVKPESNRLEAVKTNINAFNVTRNGTPKEGKVLRLNDAYNSNPIGFAAALEVLQTVAGTRKILVTPGMIELGKKQEEENRKAAERAAKFCDLVVIVGKTNEHALATGLGNGGLKPEHCKKVDTMKDAFAYLATNYLKDGDVVLIENDLPDVYETKVSF
jgi:UDP-N-acetylmuramoyl-tripeptide--D-alanyl-D-alanine ligase